jgi:hypothetical protein
VNHRSNTRHTEPIDLPTEPTLVQKLDNLETQDKHNQSLLMEIGMKVNAIIDNNEFQSRDLKQRIWTLQEKIDEVLKKVTT